MGHTVNRIIMGHTVKPDYYGTYSNTGLLWDIP